LSQKAAAGTTFNAFEVEVAGKLIIKQIKDELEEGNNVCIDDFGTFSISAETIRLAQQEHEIRAESIRVKKVVFKTSQRMMKEAGQFTFQRKPKM
jgi:nucleoid DNA-binding protein